MLRQSILILFVLFALNANANAKINVDPYSDYISLEIDKLELEQELFGTPTNGEEISIASIEVYEMEEEVNIGYDTKNYLPESFNAEEGMNDIDWSKIELYELDEELEIGYDTKANLPKNFNPYRGMICDDMIVNSIF